LLFLLGLYDFFDFFFDLAYSDVDSLSAELFLHSLFNDKQRVLLEYKKKQKNILK
jgi:hypothetical protein